MFKPGIAAGMAAPFIGLEISLAAEAQRSRRKTVSADTRWPRARNAAANFWVLFETHGKARIGSASQAYNPEMGLHDPHARERRQAPTQRHQTEP